MIDYDSLPKRPTAFFEHLIEQRWSFFVELDTSRLNNNQMSIVSLVKSCRMKNLKALKASMNRIDGKLAVVLEVEQPTFYMEYPYAPIDGLKKASKKRSKRIKEEDETMPTNGLRNTLKLLGMSKTGTVEFILDLADEVERLSLEDIIPEDKRNPFVKSVMMASLLNMGHAGDLAAIFETLDTIDGVVADKIKLLGDDVLIQNPSNVAPQGAFIGPNGFATVEMVQQSSDWSKAIAAKKGIDLALDKGGEYE